MQIVGALAPMQASWGAFQNAHKLKAMSAGTMHVRLELVCSGMLQVLIDL